MSQIPRSVEFLLSAAIALASFIQLYYLIERTISNSDFGSGAQEELKRILSHGNWGYSSKESEQQVEHSKKK